MGGDDSLFSVRVNHDVDGTDRRRRSRRSGRLRGRGTRSLDRRRVPRARGSTAACVEHGKPASVTAQATRSLRHTYGQDGAVADTDMGPSSLTAITVGAGRRGSGGRGVAGAPSASTLFRRAARHEPDSELRRTPSASKTAAPSTCVSAWRSGARCEGVRIRSGGGVGIRPRPEGRISCGAIDEECADSHRARSWIANSNIASSTSRFSVGR